MSRKAQKIINSWIRTFVPKEMAFGDMKKLAESAGLNPGTIRTLKHRGSLSADTVIAILLARGVSEDDLINLPQTGETKFSKSLSEWNRLGNTLSEGERENIIKLVHFLMNEWKLS